MRCLAVPFAIVALIAASGCGTSLRRVHRSQVYFERCYAADLDTHVPVAERHACWQTWMEHYQEGQPPDRIDYVRERILRLDPESSAIVALATGGAEDPVPLTETAPEIASEAQLVSAAISGPEIDESHADETQVAESPEQARPASETSIGAAPVAPTPVEPVTQIGDPERVPSDIPPSLDRRVRRHMMMPRTETPHCAARCQPEWDACTELCATGDHYGCLRACRLIFRTCARGCY